MTHRSPTPTDEWLGLNHLNAHGAARFSGEQLAPCLVDLLLR